MSCFCDRAATGTNRWAQAGSQGRRHRLGLTARAHGKSLSLPGPQGPCRTQVPSGPEGLCLCAGSGLSGVVSSVQCSPEGWGPLVGVESSKAAAAQRVSDTPWREARSGLVKHDPLAEPLSFPCSPPARLPPSPLWPYGAGGLSFTSTACYEFKTTLTNQTISPKGQNFQLLFTGTKTRLCWRRVVATSLGWSPWPQSPPLPFVPGPRERHSSVTYQALAGSLRYPPPHRTYAHVCMRTHTHAYTHEGWGTGCSHLLSVEGGCGPSLLRAVGSSQLPTVGRANSSARLTTSPAPASCHSTPSDLRTLKPTHSTFRPLRVPCPLPRTSPSSLLYAYSFSGSSTEVLFLGSLF